MWLRLALKKYKIALFLMVLALKTLTAKKKRPLTASSPAMGSRRVTAMGEPTRLVLKVSASTTTSSDWLLATCKHRFNTKLCCRCFINV